MDWFLYDNGLGHEKVNIQLWDEAFVILRYTQEKT